MSNTIKYIHILFLSFFCFFSLVFATGESLSVTGVTPVSLPLVSGNVAPLAVVAPLADPNLMDAQQVLKTNYVSYITFSFCDNGVSNKGFSLDAGKEKDVCVQFKNALNIDVKLWTEIVDGYTIEPFGIRGCLDNPSGNKQFIPGVIVPSRGNSLIDIPAGQTVKQYVKMKFPNGANGVKHACFTYGVTDSTANLGSNFSMRFRKESYVDFVVQGGSGIKSQIIMLPFDDGKTVNSYLDIDDKLVLEFKLQNTGSVDEMVSISGFVHNMFGFVQPFMLTGIRLNVGVTKLIRTSEYGLLFDMPFYKGFYDIQWEVSHKPFFEFDVSGFGLDPKTLAGGTLQETGNAFFFPWLLLAALLALILFIKMAFFKKARIVYVQQAAPVSPSQQTPPMPIPPVSPVQTGPQPASPPSPPASPSAPVVPPVQTPVNPPVA